MSDLGDEEQCYPKRGTMFRESNQASSPRNNITCLAHQRLVELFIVRAPVDDPCRLALRSRPRPAGLGKAAADTGLEPDRPASGARLPGAGSPRTRHLVP